jgi:4-azaleucine resistance transporter AzlC
MTAGLKLESSPRSEFWAGVRMELPVLLGTMPFGMIFGVLARSIGLDPLAALAMSSIIFAGSAQFIALNLITAAPLLIIWLTTLVVNLRHMLYSASVAPYLKPLHPLWRLALAYLMTDEAYAVTIDHYQRTDSAPSLSPYRHWFFLGAGLTLWGTWQLATAVGIFLGAQVPSRWSLDFTLALTFIALVVPALKDRPALAAAAAAGLTAVAFDTFLQVVSPALRSYKLGLLLAAVIGIGVGVWLESRLNPFIKRAVPADSEVQS